MTEPIWATPFPGGVMDALGERAWLQDAQGHGLALRLADGAVLWRSSERLRPLLADEELLVGLSLQPPRCLAYTVDGQPRWRSAPLPWPAWTLDAPDLGPACDLWAGWLEGQVLLQWRLQPPRRGGAQRAGGVPVESTGACLLRRASGQRKAAPPCLPPPAPEAEPSPDPELLAQRRHGERHYQLHRRPQAGQVHTELSALTPTGLCWRTVLDRSAPVRPTALPPRRPE